MQSLVPPRPRSHWERLWRALTTWLRRRARPPIDAEDLAGETIYRALRTLGPAPCLPWIALWMLARRTAANLLASAVRSIRRCRTEALADMDCLPRPEPAADSVHGVQRMVRLLSMADVVGAAAGAVVAAMQQGAETRMQIERATGLSRTTVKRVWRTLRALPADFGPPERSY